MLRFDNFVFLIWRIFRAQSEADVRRVKADLLKGKCTAVTSSSTVVRKDVTTTTNNRHPPMAGGDIHTNSTTTTVSQQQQPNDAKYMAELKRLRSDNAILKDANKQLEEKNTVSSFSSCIDPQ